MKKLISLILILIVLFGCANKKDITVSKLESFTIDMSGYKNMSAFDHQMLGISPDTLIKVIGDGETDALVAIGFKGCHVCQESNQYLNEVAKENNIVVYYVDAYSEKYPLIDKYSEVTEKLSNILNKDGNGNYALQTPEVFVIKDGKVVDHQLGLVDGWDFNSPKESSIKSLKNNYQSLINKLGD